VILAFLAPILLVLGPIWSFCTSRVGLPLVVAGCIVLFYEGVPIGPLRYIPYAGPVLAGFVDGRVDREYAAGQLAERLVWQEQQRKAQIKAEAKAKAQQAEIDAAAFEYASQQRADEQHIASLEEAIRLQKDEDLGPPDPKTGPVCHPGIPGGVSTRIDAIGR
jgi:hypothetical protein